MDKDKVLLDVSRLEDLQAALLGVFPSQIGGGKRYALASLARRRANATFFRSHRADEQTAVSFAMNMTPLIQEDSLSPQVFVQSLIQHFSRDVGSRLQHIMAESDQAPTGRSR
jgi:hypothetical protein